MRVKSGTVRTRRHKAIKDMAKGYRSVISRRFKTAQEAVLHAGQYAYEGRRLRKRDMRRLWITRITAGLAAINGPKYSVFINLLKTQNVVIDRKMLSELAANDLNGGFQAVVDKVWAK